MRRKSLPLLMLAQPAFGTVLTRWPGSSIFWQAFVKQNAHSLGGGEQAFAGLFEKGNGLLARNRRILFQKFVEGLAALNIIQQRPHRNPRAGEARLTTHDFRVCHHN